MSEPQKASSGPMKAFQQSKWSGVEAMYWPKKPLGKAGVSGKGSFGPHQDEKPSRGRSKRRSGRKKSSTNY